MLFQGAFCCVNILHLYIIRSGDCAPSLQGKVGLSANLNPCKQDFVFPWPVTIAVSSGVMGIFTFSLCSTSGKNDLDSVPVSVLSHCVCHLSPFIYISVATVVGILSYTMFCSSMFWNASLASLSATSFPSIPLCAFTHPKWNYQFCVVRCCTMFLISSINKLCVELFF